MSSYLFRHALALHFHAVVPVRGVRMSSLFRVVRSYGLMSLCNAVRCCRIITGAWYHLYTHRCENSGQIYKVDEFVSINLLDEVTDTPATHIATGRENTIDTIYQKKGSVIQRQHIKTDAERHSQLTDIRPLQLQL